jgi:prevent-host-death family protein
MEKSWPVQDAKARFSEVVREAEKGEAQIITRHGEETAVVLSAKEYRRLRGGKPERSLYEIWKSAPKVPEFELPPRKREKPRKIF